MHALLALLNCALAGLLGDFYEYDPEAYFWRILATSSPPSARWTHGFTSAGARLYVHGGADSNGAEINILCIG